MYNRNNIKTAFMYLPSIASAGSLIAPIFMAPAACQVTGIRVVTAGATLSTNWNLNVYKNASNASSRIATTGSLATIGSFTGTDLSTSVVTTSLAKLAANDVVLFELTSGGGTTTGASLEIDYVYGYTT